MALSFPDRSKEYLQKLALIMGVMQGPATSPTPTNPPSTGFKLPDLITPWS